MIGILDWGIGGMGIYRALKRRIAQPLSARIEAGDRSSPALVAEVRRIVAPLAACDALLLACTHYPAISPVFRGCLPGAQILDPADAVIDWLEGHWPLPPGGPAGLVVTTGSAAGLRHAARVAFAVDVGEVTTVRTGR